MKSKFVMIAMTIFMFGCNNFKKGDLVEFTNSEGICGEYVEFNGSHIIRNKGDGFLYKTGWSTAIKVDKCPER